MDASLLVLLVAGLQDPDIIEKHRRLRTFTAEDFEHLRRIASNYARVLVTPNTLTEASNLLAQHREPERSRLLHTLRDLINRSHEVIVKSAEAAGHSSFPRLGLTDAGLLGPVSRKTPLYTVDFELYHSALDVDSSSAFNFQHYQSRYA